MNLAESTILVEPGEAEAKLAEYAGMIDSERTAEDQAIAMGYRAAARGLPVIRLSQAIQAGGFHADSGMPKIAVVRANATECYAHWDARDLVFADEPYNGRIQNRGALVGQHSVRVPVAQPPSHRRFTGYWESAVAIVPIIPPRHRPKLSRIRSRHVLWEAEWTRVPPKDPALIKHIRGDLWAVLAEWDLTDLERFVLSQR